MCARIMETSAGKSFIYIFNHVAVDSASSNRHDRLQITMDFSPSHLSPSLINGVFCFAYKENPIQSRNF